MKKYKIGFIIVALVIIIAELATVNYSQLFSSKNIGPFLVIAGMIFLIVSQAIYMNDNL